MLLKKISTLFLVFSIAYTLKAGDSLYYYFITFKDKKGSPYSNERPEEFLSASALARRAKYKIKIDETDLPVNRKYIDSIRNLENSYFINSSKWLNGVEISSSVSLQSEALLRKWSFIKEVKYLGKLKIRNKIIADPIDSFYYKACEKLKAVKKDSVLPAFDEKDYGKSFDQNKLIGIPGLQRLTGKNSTFKIAVFDAGFYKAYRIRGMEDILSKDVIIRDFVDYDNSVWEDDQHGCNVLGFMKTYNPGNYIGSSPYAEYMLMRTENAHSESMTEEINWLFAAELADSAGVDLIAASVGYNLFDENKLSHKISDLNGKTSLIAKAANIAYSKGIMIVCSAGNEGNTKWHRTGTPADAESVVAIGACDEKGYHVSFSSYGPTADNRVKPDFLSPGYRVTIAAAHGFYTGNGTSYAAPIFAGALANLMSLFPELSPDEIRITLLQTSTHLNRPDSAYGYGLPDFKLAACMLGKCELLPQDGNLIWEGNKYVEFSLNNLFFRSGINQSIKINITSFKDNKLVSISNKSYHLKQGEWVRYDITSMSAEKRRRKRRKNTKADTIKVIITTKNGEYQMTYTFRK